MRTAGGDSLAAEAADGEDLSLMPPQVKEIMIRLQSENKHLKDQSERELNRTTVDKAEFHEQIETLTAEKQQYHDKVAELEALVLSGNSTGEQNTEEIQELQEKLQKSKEEDSGRKEEIANLNNILNESKEKGDEFQALLKQKEEDIKVKNRTPFHLPSLFFKLFSSEIVLKIFLFIIFILNSHFKFSYFIKQKICHKEISS